MDEITDPLPAVTDADCEPYDYGPRLPLLTLAEAQDCIEVLQYYATSDSWYGDTAVALASALASRVPSKG